MAEARRALLVYGGWEGHDPREAAEIYGGILESNGFEVQASDSLEVFADRRLLAGVDLIVPIWTMGTIEESQLKGLLHAVESGVGLAGWHGTMGDSFRNDPEYQFMVGGQLVAHPDDWLRFRVEFVDSDHPITQGLEDFELESEQYYMHVDPTNQVLATTVFETRTAPWINGARIPVAWTRGHGRGRVFYSSIGHTLDDHAIPQVRTMHTRGLLWAARAEHERTQP
jgi:hypothetical protein